MAFGKPTKEDLINKFSHHVPFGDQGERYTKVRASICASTSICVELTPCSPEQTRAVNAMQDAMMLFNAAIAINEKPT